MESGRIADEQISASSSYSDGRWTPQQSRLHGDDNGWTPNLDSSKEYLQVLDSEAVQSVCASVGEAAGFFTRVHKGHEEIKHNITENSSHPSILRNPYSRHKHSARHCAKCQDEMDTALPL